MPAPHLLLLHAKEAMRRMARLDLDARRAEADMTPHEVVLGGKTYRFVARLPVEFMTLLKQGDLEDAMRLLMLDPSEWDELRAAVPTDDDLMAIVELYGVSEGESSASNGSSPSAGTSSRPTSSPTTGSTSGRSASGRKR